MKPLPSTLSLTNYNEMAGAFFCTNVGCFKSFKTDIGRLAHWKAKLHGPHHEPAAKLCGSCNNFFATAMLLDTHRRRMHNWCFICTKGFKTAGALQQHGRSLAHTNRHLHCRVRGCEGCFKSPSGLAHHLESNTHKEIHRHLVTGVAQTIDIIPSISVRARIAGDITISPNNIAPPPSYVATAASWNGTHFECYLCRQGFKDLGSLNRHLNSAAHDVDEFKCPNNKCKRKFTLISGFVQHLESRACNLANIREIQGRFDDLTAQFDRLLAV